MEILVLPFAPCRTWDKVGTLARSRFSRVSDGDINSTSPSDRFARDNAGKTLSTVPSMYLIISSQ